MRTVEDETPFESTLRAGTRMLSVLCGALVAAKVFPDYLQQSGLMVLAVIAVGAASAVALWWDPIKEGLRDFKENMR